MGGAATITTMDYLNPGSLIALDGEDLMRVTTTTGSGPYTSTVKRLSRWERLRLRLIGVMHRAWRVWRQRVWWPVTDWVEEQWTARWPS
jgi:hypothetical protein